MKNIQKFGLLVFIMILTVACDNNDDNTPAPVNEEEVITTVIANLVAEGTVVTLTSRDLDGDGPNDPEVTISGNFEVGTTYEGTVQFLNETVTPPEDITEEVDAEADEHQVFFLLSTGLDGTIDYGNFDGNGNPLGTQFTLVPNTASTGNLTIVLRHEPKKPNNGTLADAGGETDISVTFEGVVFE